MIKFELQDLYSDCFHKMKLKRNKSSSRWYTTAYNRFLCLIVTLGLHKILSNILYIIWHMHLESLKLLSQTTWEEMHLQENSLYDLWPWPLGQDHAKCDPVLFTSCNLCSYKVWSRKVLRFRRRCIYKKIHYMTFDLDLGVKVTQNVDQNTLHHVTYAATTFEVATSNGLRGNAFTRKFIIWPLTLSLGSRSRKM